MNMTVLQLSQEILGAILSFLCVFMHGDIIFMCGNIISMHGHIIFMPGNIIFMYGNDILMHGIFMTQIFMHDTFCTGNAKLPCIGA